MGGVARAGRHAGRSPACRRSTASFPNGCCCRRSCSRRACRSRSSTCSFRWPLRALVLVAALGAYVMVKFYGVIFLGRPREAQPRLRAGRRLLRARRTGLVRRRLRRARPVSGQRDRAHRSGQRDADRRDGVPPAIAGNWLLLAPINADRSSYSPLIVLAGDRRRRAADDADRAPPVSRPRPHAPGVGLRLSAADAADAGHRGRLRAADPADLRAVLPHRAPSAVAIRSRRRSYCVKADDHFVALALSADRARGADWTRALRRPDPAGPDLRST